KGKGLVNGIGFVNGKGKGLVNGIGFVNGKGKGLVNGIGFVNGRALNGAKKGKGLINGIGLINGNGLVNGRGLINGSGLVNGKGITNGKRLLHGEPTIKRIRSNLRISFAIGIIFLLLIIVIPYFMVLEFEKRISADGYFDDWATIKKFVDEDRIGPRPGNEDVDIIAYAMYVDEVDISFYIRVAGTILGGKGENGADSVFIFIDGDYDMNTGYLVKYKGGNIGADYLLYILGWDNKIEATTVYKFKGNDGDDWNGWSSMYPGKAALSFSELEAQAFIGDMGITKDSKINVVISIKDLLGNVDYSDVGIANAPVLYISQTPTYGNVITSQTNNLLMKLELEAYLGEVNLTSLGLKSLSGSNDAAIQLLHLYNDTDRSGSISPGDKKISTTNFYQGSARFSFSSICIKEGSGGNIRLFVSGDVNINLGGVLGLCLGPAKEMSVRTGATVIGAPTEKYAYIGSYPKMVTIDGAFKDWEDVGGRLDAPNDVIPDTTIISKSDVRVAISNENVNIAEYKNKNDPTYMSYYLRVAGNMMGGAALIKEGYRGFSKLYKPEKIKEIEKKGVDTVYIFIDTDKNTSTGFRPRYFPIGADYMLAIEGKNGKVISSKGIGKGVYYSFAGKKYQLGWSWEERGVISAACDSNQLETQISFSSLGILANADFEAYIYIVDWFGNSDHTDLTIYRGGGRETKSLFVKQDGFGDGAVSKGAKNIPVLKASFIAEGDYVSLASLTLTSSNITNSDIDTISIYEDNGDMFFSIKDKQLVSEPGIFADGKIKMKLNIVIEAKEETLLFVVVNVSENAKIGERICLSISDLDCNANSVVLEIKGSSNITIIETDGRPPTIPEFSELLLPVASTILLFFAFSNRYYRKKEFLLK
ncbi:MAG: hypothetical protein AB1779_08125, partial [Candidatus Thermoplasmatota archaeon]